MPAKKQAPKAPVKKTLTKDEIESVVEQYLGIHPKYLIFEGGQIIKVNLHQAAHQGVNFPGFKPAIEQGKII